MFTFSDCNDQRLSDCLVKLFCLSECQILFLRCDIFKVIVVFLWFSVDSCGRNLVLGSTKAFQSTSNHQARRQTASHLNICSPTGLQLPAQGHTRTEEEREGMSPGRPREWPSGRTLSLAGVSGSSSLD